MSKNFQAGKRFQCRAYSVLIFASAWICLWWRGAEAIPGIPRSDYEWYFYPLRVFLSRELTGGRFPWWNPHMFCGYPMLEALQPGLLYPFNTLIMSLLPVEPGLLLFLSAHIFIASVFTAYAWRRALGVTQFAALAGAAVYAWGSVYVHRFYAGHQTITLALSWLPFSTGMYLWSFKRARRLGEVNFRALSMSAVAVACIVFSGAPQYIFYTFWAHAGAALFAGGTRIRIRIWSLVLIWSAAMLISCPQWLPLMVYLRSSGRGAGGSAVPDSGAARLCVALEFLLPYPLGDSRTYAHLQRRGIWDTSSYCGTAAIILSAVVPLLNKLLPRFFRKRVLPGLGVMIMAIYLIAGLPVPGFTFFRESVRGMILLILAASMLVPVALDALRCCPGFSRRVSAFCVLWLCAVGMLLLVIRTKPREYAVFVSGLTEAYDVVHQSTRAVASELSRNSKVATAPATYACIWSMVAAVLLLVILQLPARLRVGAAAMLLFVDPFSRHHDLLIPGLTEAEAGWPVSFDKDLQSLGEQMLTRKEGPLRCEIPSTMTNGSQLVPGIFQYDGTDPLQPAFALARGASITRAGLGRFTSETLRSINMAVGYRIAEETDGRRPVESMKAYERTFRIEKISTSATAAELVSQVIISDDHRLGPVNGTNHFIRSMDAGMVPAELMGQNGSTTETALPIWLPRRSPAEIAIRATVDHAALLLVKVTWAQGWQCKVDGKKRNIVCTNGWMLGVPLDRGTHIVEFSYRPMWYGAACAVSIGTLMMMLWGILAFNYSPRRTRRTGRIMAV